MYSFTFYKKSKKVFDKLDIKTQNQFLTKLRTLKNVEDIFVYLKPLVNMDPATHRLRMGGIRMIFEQDEKNQDHFFVFKIGKKRRYLGIKD